MSEHKLTLTAEQSGVVGRCTCGWTTGCRYSSLIASAAFRDHVEEAAEKEKGDD